MSHEKSRREVLLGSAAIAAAIAAPSIAKSKSGASSARVYQGGTNPIVIGPKQDISTGAGRGLRLTIYPAIDDKPGDKYIVEAFYLTPVFKDGKVVFETENTDIKGIKDGYFKESFTFDSSIDSIDVAVPKIMTVPLVSTDETRVVTFVLYSATGGSRSSIMSFELLKN